MEKYLKLHLYYASAAIVLFILVAYLSLMPSTGLPKTAFNGIDKLVHMTMYFVLSLIAAMGFFNLNKKGFVVKLIPIVLSFFYSIAIEFLQEMCTNSRFFEIFDILANGIGCLLAFVFLNTQFFNNKMKQI